MTNATETKTTFIVRYPVTTYVAVEVERPSDITREELLDTITRDELIAGETQDDCAWDSLKSSWREGDAEIYTYDDEDQLDYDETRN